jgi:small subunit ribosomal protein S1
LKQTEVNPWAIASQKYPAGTILSAKVRSLTNFGVFVEVEPGIDGMIHISDLSWTRKYNHPGEALQKGKEVKCIVLEVNEERRRVSLGIKQMTEDPWIRAIPEKYIPGHIIKGKVAKLTNFGAFVELEPDLEGLLHISELADHKIDKPQDVVGVGDEVEVKILKVDTDARKIGLSLRRVQWAAEEQTAGSGQQQALADIDKVLSDADVSQLVKPQDKADQGKEADAGAGDDSSTEDKVDHSKEADAGAGDDSGVEDKANQSKEADAGAGDDSSAEEKTEGA